MFKGQTWKLIFNFGIEFYSIPFVYDINCVIYLTIYLKSNIDNDVIDQNVRF